MNATKYQIFLKTVECGSFTKAAADLNFSQSGISHAINSLEEELGVTLLSRNRGGVTLTGDGRALLPQIQQLCTEYHRLAQQAADLRGMDAGLVKVASFSSVSAQWLPMILKAFSKQYPAIEFEIQTCDFYDQIEELIITGQADCGFLRMPSLKGLQVYPLHLDQLKVIVPCGHPLSHCDPFPVEALATEPVIQLEEGDDYEIRAAFDEMGVLYCPGGPDHFVHGVQWPGYQPAAGADGAAQPLPPGDMPAAHVVLPAHCHRRQG